MCSSYYRYQSKQFVLKDTILEIEESLQKIKSLREKAECSTIRTGLKRTVPETLLNLKSAAAKQRLYKKQK